MRSAMNAWKVSVRVACVQSGIPALIASRKPMISMAWCTVRLLICAMSLGIWAMRDAISSVRSSNSSVGNTRVANPHSTASAPLSGSPVSIISMPLRIPHIHAWYCRSGVPKRTAG